MTVLLLGGTGRTGGRVLQQLLGRGVSVRAVVRSAERLPSLTAASSGSHFAEAAQAEAAETFSFKSISFIRV